MPHEVLIVGAGLSGLCCARELHQQGISSQIIEASDGIGGRVRTDVVDGFRLDRGFQVLLTEYPEAKRVRCWRSGSFARRCSPSGSLGTSR